MTQLAVVPYFRTLADTRRQTEREQDLLLRERALLTSVKVYPRYLDEAEAALLAEAPRLMGGPDLATASAALVNYVSIQATRHRVFVQHSETRPPVPSPSGVARIQVDVSGVGDLEGILGLLVTLESGSKLIAVDPIVITAADPVGSAQTQGEEVLGFGATVTGYSLGDPGAPPDEPIVSSAGASP